MILTTATPYKVFDLSKEFFCLEYDALSRLGISDGRQFLKRRFQKLPVKFLPTCCVGESLQGQVEAAIDEALSSGEWIDILVSVFANLLKLFIVIPSTIND